MDFFDDVRCQPRLLVLPLSHELGAGEQVAPSPVVIGKNAGESAPFGGHIGNGQPLVHAERGDARSCELDATVEYFVIVENADQGDNHVLAADAGSKFAAEIDLDDVGHLPPGSPGGPDGGGVGTNHGGAQCAQRPVKVGMRIAAHDKRAGQNETLLDHDLMADPTTRRIKHHAVFLGERLDLGVFRQVLRTGVLNVMVEGVDRLPRVGHRCRTHAFELGDDGCRVVVRHDVGRTD